MLSHRMGALFVALLCAGSVSAYDFGPADRLFDARENNPSAIAQARALYQAALKQTQGAEQVYAVEQLGKLAYYEGELLSPPGGDNQRMQIFAQCLKDTDVLNPSRAGKSGAFYYWKGLCLALWGKAAGTWSALGKVNELKGYLSEGKAFPAYQGGGVHRLTAGIYIRSKLMRIVGLYDPEAALEHINSAISYGPQHFNSYLIKGEALRELGRTDEAIETLTAAKQELNRQLAQGSIPSDLLPESKVYLRQIDKLLSEL